MLQNGRRWYEMEGGVNGGGGKNGRRGRPHRVFEEEIDHLSTKCFFFMNEKLCLTDNMFT